jgi:signal transduction histidine kinase
MTKPSSTAKNTLTFHHNETNTLLHPLEVHHLSHDLRGPLNSILGFSELLLEGIEGPLNDMQSEDIVAIYQSAQNLLLLINNVVDISKLQAGTMAMDFGPVEINKILQKISTTDFGIKKPAEVELVIHQAANQPLVWGDGPHLEQLTLNLIRYAFTLTRTGQVTLTAKEEGETVMVAVALKKVHISTSDVPTLFELGVEVDAAGRSELGPGGLELPLARLLAEMHKGRVWVESNATTGTTFYVQLPAYQETVT